MAAVTGDAETGGVAEAITDLEWRVREDASAAHEPAYVSPDRLDAARPKPKASTFARAGLKPVTPPEERAARRRTQRAALEEDLARRSGLELPHDERFRACLLYTSPSPRDQRGSRMPSSA